MHLLRLKHKTKNPLSKIEAFKEIIHTRGLNSEEIITKEAQRPNRTTIDYSQLENQQLVQLTTTLKQQTLKEIDETA